MRSIVNSSELLIPRLERHSRETLTYDSTLRATSTLLQDPDLALNTAKDVCRSLREWHLTISHVSKALSCRGEGLDSACELNFAYMLLEILVYRAVLRSLGRRAHAGNVVPGGATDGLDGHQSTPQQIPEMRNGRTLHAAAEAALCAAENCVNAATNFIAKLTSKDFSGFWHSCKSYCRLFARHLSDTDQFAGTRTGFVTISSFTMLLMIQAPDEKHAKFAINAANSWRSTLKYQSNGYWPIKMAALRLDTMYWLGIENAFVINTDMLKALRQGESHCS